MSLTNINYNIHDKILLFKNIIKVLLIVFSIGIIIVKLSLKLQILICTIAKKENKYINEFVEHYLNLKITKIIIYDNNDINGEDFYNILQKYIRKRLIKIINIRGIKRPQKKALNDCYKNNNKNYDWIGFYDIDEFLYINNYTNLNNFLSLSKFKKCQGLLINWKYYGDNNQVYYENKPVQQRFIKIFPTELLKKKIYYYSAAKSIIRGRLSIKWGHCPHYIKNIINCRADGRIIKNYFSPPQYSIAYINHYITKSTEEFIERINRGDVILKVNNNYIENRIKNYYFFFNKITKKKLYLFYKKLKYKINFKNFKF